MKRLTLGQMYGVASRTIARQRDEIASLRMRVIACRTVCRCGAWDKICDEARDEELLRKELERTKEQLRAARTFQSVERENPRCSCNHLWADHKDGGVCGYTYDKWDSVAKVYRKVKCHHDCQQFKPWRAEHRREYE